MTTGVTHHGGPTTVASCRDHRAIGLGVRSGYDAANEAIPLGGTCFVMPHLSVAYFEPRG
jgi:hypothetical protein